jgi:hypothetical protein
MFHPHHNEIINTYTLAIFVSDFYIYKTMFFQDYAKCMNKNDLILSARFLLLKFSNYLPILFVEGLKGISNEF